MVAARVAGTDRPLLGGDDGGTTGVINEGGETSFRIAFGPSYSTNAQFNNLVSSVYGSVIDNDVLELSTSSCITKETKVDAYHASAAMADIVLPGLGIPHTQAVHGGPRDLLVALKVPVNDDPDAGAHMVREPKGRPHLGHKRVKSRPYVEALMHKTVHALA